MNRRAFLGTLLGAGAAAVAAPLLPSEVWPFRKIFLPGRYLMGFDWGYGDVTITGTSAYNGTFKVMDCSLKSMQEQLDAIEAIQLEAFAKEIPDLLAHQSTVYSLFKKRPMVGISGTEFQNTMRTFKQGVDGILLGEGSGIGYAIPPLGYRPSQLTATAAIRETENRNRKRVDILANWPEQVPLRMANGNEIEMPRNLLHAKATPENIERWIDELVPKSKG